MDSHLLVVSSVSSCSRSEAEMNPRQGEIAVSYETRRPSTTRPYQMFRQQEASEKTLRTKRYKQLRLHHTLYARASFPTPQHETDRPPILPTDTKTDFPQQKHQRQ